MIYVHLIFGLIVLIVFLVTGRFMRLDFPDKEIIAPEFRMLMRSRHIYILFSSLIHIFLGIYFQMQTKLWRKFLQIIGSSLLILSSLLLVWAFVYETYLSRDFTQLSRYGVYLSLAGVILHLAGMFRLKNKRQR